MVPPWYTCVITWGCARPLSSLCTWKRTPRWRTFVLNPGSIPATPEDERWPVCGKAPDLIDDRRRLANFRGRIGPPAHALKRDVGPGAGPGRRGSHPASEAQQAEQADPEQRRAVRLGHER